MSASHSGVIGFEVLPETGSTNQDLIERIAAGDRLSEGHWLLADRQISGRGRQGRTWSDGAGNFMGSTIVRVEGADPPPQTLSFVAALALYEAAAPSVSPPVSLQLKWPNDLLVNGAKLAGILLERVNEIVIVGIGVNLVQAPHLTDRATACLAQFGPPPGRDTFADMLAAHFAQELHRWRNYGFEPIRRRWLAAAHPIGTPLSVANGSEPALEGTFAGLDDSGFMRLQLADGAVRSIMSGEVGQRTGET